MTKKLFITNINEIRTIKITCQKCGLAIDIPVKGSAIFIDGCADCGVKFPINSVKNILESIRALQGTLSNKDFKEFQGINVTFETDME